MAHLINLICQICQKVRSVRESDLWKSCDLSESPIGLTDLRVRSASHGWPAVRVRSSGQSHLYQARIGLSRPASRGRPIGLSNLWGRSDSQITWLCVERPCSASHGLTDLRVRSASQIWESDRPPTDSRWSNAFSREISQTAPRIGLHRPVESDRPLRSHFRGRPCSLIGSERSHDKLWEAEAMRGRGRPNLGGRGRPWGSDWLR